MSDLKALIKGLRQENFHHRKFVPELSLCRAMTKDVVCKALEDSGISLHQQEEIATRIIRSGRKIFAILVLIDRAADILRFTETDELHDVKLPFKLEVLSDEISISNPEDFDERQWEFAAPTFVRGTLNRYFREKVVLPFATKSDEGSGAFGKVYRVQLHRDHQEIENPFPQEKELDNADDHRKELENLSILNHLKHPNIVELLASYTHQNKHSLLFPRAEHGTLAALFQTSRLATNFLLGSTFLDALVGIASAVEHVHDFFERRIDLRLIGCHHDLRPHNILVSGTTFILADFGLSRFKEASRDSGTPFQRGMGDYLAPECEDHETFEPHRIGRSSDIWSLGCILAEAATYMAHGHRAVEDFRGKRRSVVRAFIFHLFHNGPNEPSAVVEDWLSQLERSKDKSCIMLAILARRMLSISVSERPTAGEVTRRLRFITLSRIATTVSRLYRKVKAKIDSFEIVIEQMRFKAWKYAVSIIDLENDPSSLWTSKYGENIQYDSIRDYLVQVRDYLEWRLLKEEDAGLDFSQLRSANDRLSELLGPKQQERSSNFFRISIIDTDQERITSQVESDDRVLSLEKEIRLSAALKRMSTQMMDNHDMDTSQRQIESSKMRIIGKFGDYNFGQIKIDGHKNRMLVEWRRYEDYSSDEVISPQVFVQLNATVKRMSADKPASMRVLHCCGYYQNEHRNAFGILYEMPHSMGRESNPIQYTTLDGWIVKTTDKVRLWPILDDRFRLAYTLAKSVWEFHLCGWLHKDLKASNVAFFSIHGTSLEEHIKEPYIIGFNHDRPDDPAAFTSDNVNSGVIDFRHPKYRRNAGGYGPEDDYYSLGIVLMEIGYWRPFHEIVGYQGTYGEELDRKLKDQVPQLKQCMGRDFCAAVMACINGDFISSKANDEKGNNKDLFIDFESKVLSRLNGCLV